MPSVGVTVDSLVASYGAAPIFQNLEFAISPGEFVVVVGPSGSGKSSLLRVLAGLEPPIRNEGTIRLGDRDVTQLRPGRRGVGFVFQDFSLYPHLAVAANISMSLRCRITADFSLWERLAFWNRHGIRRRLRDIDERVRSVAEKLRLTELLGRKPAELSGGEQQRVALARAIVRGDELNLLLFDEPLSNLDVELRSAVRDDIVTLQQSTNVTTLYVTHDPLEALSMGSRVLVLGEGAVEQFATASDVYWHPASLLVANLLGEFKLNTASVEITVVGDQTLVHAFGATIPLPGHGQRIQDLPRKALLGIRPEMLVASRETPSASTADSCIRMRVSSLPVERLGPSRIVRGTTPDGSLLRVLLRDVDVHEKTTLFADASRCPLFLFHPTTKKLIYASPRSRVNATRGEL